MSSGPPDPPVLSNLRAERVRLLGPAVDALAQRVDLVHQHLAGGGAEAGLAEQVSGVSCLVDPVHPAVNQLGSPLLC